VHLTRWEEHLALPHGELKDLCGNGSKNMEINTLHVSMVVTAVKILTITALEV
jgi:hypothetical protein